MASLKCSKSCSQRVAAYVEDTGFTAFKINHELSLCAGFLAYCSPLVSIFCCLLELQQCLVFACPTKTAPSLSASADI